MIYQHICFILLSFFVLLESKRLSEKDAIDWLKFVYRYPEIKLIHSNFNDLQLPYYVTSNNSQLHSILSSEKIPYNSIAFPENGISDLIPLVTGREFIPSNSSLPGHKCGNDILYTISRVMKMEIWAIQMLDASGKPLAGIMRGAITWLGSEKECKEVSAPATTINDIQFGGFTGRQCLISWNLTLGSLMKQTIKTGVCVPDSCNSEYLKNNSYMLEQLLNFAGSSLGVKMNDVIQMTDVDCSDHARSWTNGDIAYMFILSLLCTFVVIGTILDIMNRIRSKDIYISFGNESDETSCSKYDNVAFSINEDDTSAQNVEVVSVKEDLCNEQKPVSSPIDEKKIPSEQKTGFIKELLICFSLYTNGAKLLSVRNQKGQLGCLHGIRFLSMSWVILGHSFLFSVPAIVNRLDVIEYLLNSFSFLAILQGTFAVDTFFFLSGFLLVYLFLKEYGKSDKSVNWVYYYVHRIWRLSPAFFMLLGFYATLWLHLGSGPLWPTETDNGYCDKYWWWNILYILNFRKTICMAWTWYLANDMQFYVISPLFLVFLWKLPIVGNILVSIVLLSCWITTGIISANNNFNLLFGNAEGTTPQQFMQNAGRLGDLFADIYIKPYCRIGAYLVGIFAGYALYKTNGRQKFMKLWMSLIGWIVALFLISIVIFGAYRSNMGVATAAAYNALSRTAWAIGVGWIVFACLTGSGGPINRLLSWKFWVPLSRLTYCAYLVHPMIMYWYYFSLKSTLHFEIPTMVFYYFGFLMASYLAALVASLILESPMMALEKCILNHFSRN